MCELSTKLVRWLDQELLPGEAAATEQHVAACRECRQTASLYQEASQAFALYANGIYAQGTRPARRRPPVLLLASTLAAALIALFLLTPRHPAAAPVRMQVSASSAPAEVVTPSAPADPRRTPRFRSVAAASRPRALRPIAAPTPTWMPIQPTIQIAIPFDALFPPGAVPEGFAFLADLSLAVDGSPSELALRP
jgi:anti-sigma factor RsiW